MDSYSSKSWNNTQTVQITYGKHNLRSEFRGFLNEIVRSFLK